MADDTKKEVGALWKKLFGEDFQEKMIKLTIERFQNSWGEQPREEKRWRLRYIERMVFEKDRIFKAYGHGCLAWCDMAIEAVIMGDKDDMRITLGMFNFEGEDAEYQAQMIERFKTFKEICAEALGVMSANRDPSAQA